MLVTLILCILLFIGLGFNFYNKQRRNKSIGGAISKAKTIWLFFALFQYYFFSVFVLLLCFGTLLTPVLVAACGFFLLRFILQFVIMYFFKKWRPPMGIAMNIVSFLVIISMLFHFMSGNIFEWIAWDRVAFLYTVLILCILATDSVYAWMFYKIVGLRTMGENGIWFASDDDPAFRKINWITSRLNIFFFIFFGLILYLIFTNYGSYVY
ncbi:MAG: hypothetical protein IPO45_09990 [Saprospiraceae bacterium]|jgi:hypothetical protein|nr:hypothetical protein [Candidatus Brachybacter algidus]HQW71579.1 hypothetical protein [Saprospiraceae bacterium]